jgi:hypothetical protein
MKKEFLTKGGYGTSILTPQGFFRFQCSTMLMLGKAIVDGFGFINANLNHAHTKLLHEWVACRQFKGYYTKDCDQG